MKAFLKISAIVLLVLTAVLIGSGIYFSKRVKPLIISQLNKQLDVKVEVQEVELTSIWSFPRMGIQFKNVVINEAIPHYNQAVLDAKELNLYVDLLKLLKKEYVIDAVSVSNGNIRLADLEQGSNYDIFKKDSSASEPISFAIDELDLIECKLLYLHQGSEFALATDISAAKAEILSSPEKTDIKMKGSLIADSITHSGDYYLKGQTLEINTQISLKEDFSKVVISPTELVVDEVKLNTEGVVVLDQTSTIDLRFNNKESSLSKIVPILPDYIQSLFDHLEFEGQAVITGYFKGMIDDDQFPSFGIKYSLVDGQLNSKEQAVKLNNIKASGQLNIPSLGDLSTAFVSGKIERASSGSDYISGNFWVDDFTFPLIKWDGKASFRASTLSGILNHDALELNAGDLSLSGKFEFRYNTDKEEVSPNSFKYIGELRGRNITGAVKDPDLNIKSANVHLLANDKQIVIKQCEIDYDQTSIELQGYVRNANDFFSAHSKSEITGTLRADNLNVNDFISQDSTEELSEISGTIFPYHIILDTEFKNLKFNDFTAQSASGTLYSNQREIKMPNAEIVALEGHTKASLKFTTIGQYYLLDINAKMDDVNIEMLFADFNNFEQSEITADHLSGRLSGSLIAKVMLDAQFEPVLDKLYAKAQVEVLEGALIGYEPLKELSNFVEVSELENVKFSRLSNTIEIFDQTIFIPKMYIGNNALSIELEGTHNFDNYMDYHLDINLIELLAQKSNWFAKKKLQRIEDNERGGLTAYVHMEGTPDDLKITYDKLTMKKVVKEEIQQEKREFIKVLKGEDPEDQTPDSYYEDIWDE